METLVLRCPTEVTPFLSKIVATALEYIKYDPVCEREIFNCIDKC